MNFKLIKKWFFRVVLAQIVVSIAAFSWVDYQVNRMWGGHTEVVDYRDFQTPQTLIAIKNVSALSPDGNTMLANQTVVIRQGKIQSIGTNVPVPNDASVINGNGKYLIPGLIDSHVHLWQSPNDLLLYLANGVTHIRELNGSEDHLRWRDEISNGRIGPRLFVASSRLSSESGFKSLLDFWTAKTASISGPEMAEQVLTRFADAGYDAVKVYSFLDRQDFLALNKATQKVNIPILGHVPISTKLNDIWGSSLTELAHIEEIVKALDREFGGYDSTNSQEFLEFVKQRGDDVSGRMADNNMAVVTTLWLTESFVMQRHDLNKALEQSELTYVNPGISELSPLSSRVMGWLPDSNIYRIDQGHSHDVLERDKAYWNTYARAHQILLAAMLKQNVNILAGTDANVPTTVPGFSMHDELASLTKAGMTPAQALRSATAIPARWMNVKSGKVETGYNADLVLLNANPLDNIEHTDAIHAVISRGQLFSREKLNELLGAVKEANDKSRNVNIDQYQ